MLTEAEFHAGETCEVGEWHLWCWNDQFCASMDWSEDEEPSGSAETFATYAEFKEWVDGLHP